MAVLTGAFLRFKLSHVLRHTNGRDGSPIKNDYLFLINCKKVPVRTVTNGNIKVTYHLAQRLKIYGVRVAC